MGKNKKNKGQKITVAELNQRARESGLNLENNFGAADTARSGDEYTKGIPEVVQKAEPTQAPTEPVVTPVNTAPVATEPVPPVKSERFPNRLKKSTITGPTKAVWDIADRLVAADPTTQRKHILKACIDAGIAFYTARTQIQQWFAAQQASRLQAAVAASPMVKAS